jgi:hypothetical protein
MTRIGRLLERLPWRRRARTYEQHATAARHNLHRVHQDWTPLARDLARIDREIELNDWTATAKRIFAGEG